MEKNSAITFASWVKVELHRLFIKIGQLNDRKIFRILTLLSFQQGNPEGEKFKIIY